MDVCGGLSQSPSWQIPVLLSGDPADPPGVPGVLGRHGEASSPAPSLQIPSSIPRCHAWLHSSLVLTKWLHRGIVPFSRREHQPPEAHGGWVAGTT